MTGKNDKCRRASERAGHRHGRPGAFPELETDARAEPQGPGDGREEGTAGDLLTTNNGQQDTPRNARHKKSQGNMTTRLSARTRRAARPTCRRSGPARGRQGSAACSQRRPRSRVAWRRHRARRCPRCSPLPLPSVPPGLTHAVCSSPSEGGGAGPGAAAAEAGLTQWAGGAWGPRAGQDGPPPFAWGLSAGHLASRSPRVTAGRVSTATYRLFSLTHRRPPAVTTTGEDRGAHTPDAARPDGGALPGPGRASAWSSVPCEP